MFNQRKKTVLFDLFDTCLDFRPDNRPELFPGSGHEPFKALIRAIGMNRKHASGKVIPFSESKEGNEVAKWRAVLDVSSCKTLAEFANLVSRHENIVIDLNDIYAGRSIDDFERFFYSGLAFLYVYPDVERALRRLKMQGYQLGVVSDINYMVAGFVKERFKDIFSLFEAFNSSSKMGLSKRNPTLYLQVIDSMRIMKEQSWMIGDNFSADYESARAAGLHAMLIERAPGRREKMAIEHPGVEFVTDMDQFIAILMQRGFSG